MRTFQYKGHTYTVQFYTSACGTVRNTSIKAPHNLAAGFSISNDETEVHVIGRDGSEARGPSIQAACEQLWDALSGPVTGQ